MLPRGNLQMAADGGKARATSGSDEAKPASEVPRFPFPFEPYGVQQELMTSIFRTLQDGGVGIFESPTGTVRLAPPRWPVPLQCESMFFHSAFHKQGKSLSTICSTLLWLKRYAPALCAQKPRPGTRTASCGHPLTWIRIRRRRYHHHPARSRHRRPQRPRCWRG